jgi:hypothetical protein
MKLIASSRKTGGFCWSATLVRIAGSATGDQAMNVQSP